MNTETGEGMTPRERVKAAFENSRTVTHKFTIYVDLAEIDARNDDDNLEGYLERILSGHGFRSVRIEFDCSNR